ncbi:NADH:flavin oxidoreductase/NADH oxidase [Vreelandella titanicae]|uniref:NADPH dehydrogenase n=1 Tax=Vreelandella titanicae TaxID=664683 RepID=A0AAP9NRD2_9GAMM|nr:NADH:flavin oxidoreductase/NADH oxidase [Halomonas titanicae]QKS26746.1 NADPH dehydrogenase [Halomonas titanicae]
MKKSAATQLFIPLSLGGVEIPNRIVISPMCQYSASEGIVNDWHLVQLGRYALGGAGMVFAEASAVTRDGRITHGDLGIWSDRHIPGLRRLASFLSQQGSVPAIQLAHAGRKGSAARPWEGGAPLSASNNYPGEPSWPTVSAGDKPLAHQDSPPSRLTIAEMKALKNDYVKAAKRALLAGFKVIELHCGHGYLLHQFLSPLSNNRQDTYGGSLANRCSYPLEIAAALRESLPNHTALLVRISAVDGHEDGWNLQDSIYFGCRLKEAGVNMIDCSSGGIAGSATTNGISRGYGFQVPFAEAIRQAVEIPTMAVGLIVDAVQAEEILKRGQADLIAIAREALVNPHWALHAEQQLNPQAGFERWPQQVRGWLDNRARTLYKLSKASIES